MGKRLYIRTYGCQMNRRDSESLQARLHDFGYELADSEAAADVIILNTCSVREAAETKVLGKLFQLAAIRERRTDFRFGIVGCMAQNRGRSLFQTIPSLDFMASPSSLENIPEILERSFRGEKNIVALGLGAISEIHARAHDFQDKKYSAFVSIATGCNMKCSYCVVPFTRGEEICRQPEDILREICELAVNGVKEVTLLGQIVNQYGLRILPCSDGKSPFVQLLERIQEIPGIERIRFTSPHPCGFRQDLIDCYGRLSKLCPHVHLPIQSGSDGILKAMGRPYSREKVRELVRKLREIQPQMAISTDFIVGFPGETAADFNETASLFSEIAFDMAFIFKYSPRFGTPAAAMENQIPETLSEERHRQLLNLLRETSLARNLPFVGTIQSVLVERFAKKSQELLMGYSRHFKKVFFPGGGDVFGEILPVRILEARPSCLLGEIV